MHAMVNALSINIIEPENNHIPIEEWVLLPGFGFNSLVFERFIVELKQKKNVRIMLIDLPQCIFPFNIETMATELLIKAPKQATWVGWSLGGLLILWLAGHHKDRISKFITLCTTPKFINKSDEGMSLTIFKKFQTLLKDNRDKASQEFLFLQTGKRYDKKFFSYFKNRLSLETLSSETIMGHLDILQKTDLRDKLENIRSQGHCFFADEDKLVPKAALKIMKKIPYVKTHLILNAGHGTLLYEPWRFFQHLI